MKTSGLTFAVSSSCVYQFWQSLAKSLEPVSAFKQFDLYVSAVGDKPVRTVCLNYGTNFDEIFIIQQVFTHCLEFTFSPLSEDDVSLNLASDLIVFFQN
jgi:hypothetical protein